jgi:signal transduction histidine kinase
MLYSAAAYVTMVTIGPALATGVRYLRFSVTLERVLVAGAILLGLAISFGVDQIASEAVVKLVAIDIAPATPEKSAASEIGTIFGIMFLVLVYFLLGGGLAARAYYSEMDRWAASRRGRELAVLRTQKTEADMRLAVLQAQVEPHFLFNTLASVRSLVRHEPPRAEAMIDALVDYLRVTIPQLRAGSSELDSTLGRQLDICASYLKLMQVRMGQRLTFVIEAGEELRGQAFPPLMLISLVENAIKHGIEPKPGPGKITIRAAAVTTDAGPRLEVSVADDGAGLAGGMGSGVGLANVREQLKARFGDRARLDLRNQPSGGVIASISVPL